MPTHIRVNDKYLYKNIYGNLFEPQLYDDQWMVYCKVVFVFIFILQQGITYKTKPNYIPNIFSTRFGLDQNHIRSIPRCCRNFSVLMYIVFIVYFHLPSL